MISNPVSFPHHKLFFTYEGGLIAYHFSAHDSKIPRYEHYMGINLLFFANDPEHAKDVLERMLKWSIKYRKYNSISSYHEAQHILNYKDQWVIVEAPMYQFYEVGWAANDTLF